MENVGAINVVKTSMKEEYSIKVGTYIYSDENENKFVTLHNLTNEQKLVQLLRKEIARLQKIIDEKQTVYKTVTKTEYVTNDYNFSGGL